ncbi:MAG: YccF domain-containing protein [Clostridia bacterium]|nr:YccF domain-containing protein [Clostridia bacterium]
MTILGNFLWLITGGFLSAFCWVLSGLFWTVTVVGIPWARQCFKFARLSLAPFGKEVLPGGGAPSLIANVIWLLGSGFVMAFDHILTGLLLCLTVVGIPFGLQHFKLARLALFPFGARILTPLARRI